VTPARIETAPKAAAPAADLEPLLLAIVADKTGYPAEMLGMHMELEADLGIDSIKRVEILSAMRDRVPNLPEVDAAEMGALRTLGQIATRMRAASGKREATTRPSATDAPADAAEAEPPPAESAQRFAVELIVSRAIGLAPVGLWGSRVLVTEDGGGLAAAVVRELKNRGIDAETGADAPADSRAVVFLGGLRPVTSVDEALAVNREAFRLAHNLAPQFTQHGGVLVTVQDTGGDFGLRGAGTRAWLSGVAALARTAAAEWEPATVRALDLERGGCSDETLAERLVTELLNGGRERDVAIDAEGNRRTVRAVPVEPPFVRGSPLVTDPVVLVSGGARGVTAASIVALAAETKGRFVLLGRSKLEDEPAFLAGAKDEAAVKRALLDNARQSGRTPSPAELGAEASRILAGREVRATLDAIAVKGGAARYVAVDVQDSTALSEALAPIRREWGPVTGIVHGAGVLADKGIAEKTQAQFDRVFNTKIEGLRALLSATAEDPVELRVRFSAGAARVGNIGQCDYAMANEILNKVAIAESHRRGGKCRVKSLGWGPWEGGMVTPALRRAFEQRGVALIPIAAGAGAFVEEACGSSPGIELVVGVSADRSALGASTGAVVTLEANVARASHPYLEGHSIGGRAVVPVALVLEWFARGALACRPDLCVSTINDMRVLRGIRLDGFDGAGKRFRVEARQLSNGAGALVGLELLGEDGARHYSATAEMSAERPRPPALAKLPETRPWGSLPIYDGHVLFHGDAFHVIREVDGVSEEGLVGTLVGVREKRWPAEPWRTDPAALDGGLQLAVLWAREVNGGAASLPMAIGAWRCYAELPADGPMRCIVHARKVRDGGAVCDVVLAASDGRVLAELKSVETVVRPGEKVQPPQAQA
jgi:hypothetical protein